MAGCPLTCDRVLVTGAFGLVGSAVVATLARQGRHVIATDLDIGQSSTRANAYGTFGSPRLGETVRNSGANCVEPGRS